MHIHQRYVVHIYPNECRRNKITANYQRSPLLAHISQRDEGPKMNEHLTIVSHQNREIIHTISGTIMYIPIDENEAITLRIRLTNPCWRIRLTK